MNLLLGLLLSAVVSERGLRFEAVCEQRGEDGCGPAVVSSLLAAYCGKPASEEGLRRRLATAAPGASLPAKGGATIAQLVALLLESGVGAKAFRMDFGRLSLATSEGYLPMILHYDRPSPHYALLLGLVRRDGGEIALQIESGARPGGGHAFLFATADPARGVELLGLDELAARWSGAVILIDPRAITPEGRGLRDAVVAGAIARRRILLAGEAASAAIDRLTRPREDRGGGLSSGEPG